MKYLIKTETGDVIADLIESGPIMTFKHACGKLEIDHLLFLDLFSMGSIYPYEAQR
jgi:hypothetical protein